MILDPKTSQRIFALAKDQQEELEPSDEEEDGSAERKRAAFLQTRSNLEDDQDGMEDDVADEDAAEDEEYPELVRMVSCICELHLT